MDRFSLTVRFRRLRRTNLLFYFQTHQDRIAGTVAEIEDRPPRNPLFHWKTIGQSHVFGYDTLLVDFIPISDADLFELARMARAYTDLCGLVDCPLPPYLTDLDHFTDHVTLTRSINGSENSGRFIRLFLTYPDPKTGEKFGPVEFFDSALTRARQERR